MASEAGSTTGASERAPGKTKSVTFRQEDSIALPNTSNSRRQNTAEETTANFEQPDP